MCNGHGSHEPHMHSVEGSNAKEMKCFLIKASAIPDEVVHKINPVTSNCNVIGCEQVPLF